MKTQLTLIILFNTFIAFGQDPIADFQVNIDYKCGYATTEFINNSVNADTFLWDVDGNGNYIETFEPAGSNIGSDKTWIVTLIAKQNGLSDTVSKELDIVNTKVSFDTTLSDIYGYAPLTVGFSNMSEVRAGETVSYHWDFGDGTQSDEYSPEHTYVLPGTYFVTLTGNKSDGCELSYYDYIIVKDTAQKGEFEFVDSNCISDSEVSPCGYEKYYKLVNDSLIVYGFYYGNCGTEKTATIRYNGDTVKINTWEVGPMATCSCGYCFEISIPNITRDSVNVTFDGLSISKESTSNVGRNDDNLSITVYPNPVTEYLTLDIEEIDLKNFEFKIFDIEGRIIKSGNLNGESQIDLDDIESGFYLLKISGRSENKMYVTRFLKE